MQTQLKITLLILLFHNWKNSFLHSLLSLQNDGKPFAMEVVNTDFTFGDWDSIREKLARILVVEVLEELFEKGKSDEDSQD